MRTVLAAWVSHPVTAALVVTVLSTLFAASELLLRSLAELGNVRFQGILEENPNLFRGKTGAQISHVIDVARWLQLVLLGALWLAVARIPGVPWGERLAAACFFVVRVSSDLVLPYYLCWYLNQPQVEHYLSRHSGRGVHMPVVRRSVLENINIPIPPIEVQVKITKLDVLLQNEMELLDKLAGKRKKLITAACMHAVRNNS